MGVGPTGPGRMGMGPTGLGPVGPGRVGLGPVTSGSGVGERLPSCEEGGT